METFEFSLDPLSPLEPDEITITRPSGEIIGLDPRQAQLKLTEERPPLDNMEGDWGAVCEVFRRKRDTFLTLRGARLAAGDLIAIRYPGGVRLHLRVIEMEGALAHVTAER
jgi:hypothetical protein